MSGAETEGMDQSQGNLRSSFSIKTNGAEDVVLMRQLITTSNSLSHYCSRGIT